MPKGKAMSDAEKAKRQKEKGDKFRTIGTRRLQNALKAINALAPLANKNAYDYSSEQVAVIEKHLDEAVTAVVEGFKGKAAVSTGVTL